MLNQKNSIIKYLFIFCLFFCIFNIINIDSVLAIANCSYGWKPEGNIAFDNGWSLKITYGTPKDYYWWSFDYTRAEICPSTGCNGENFYISQTSSLVNSKDKLASLFNNEYFYNIGNEYNSENFYTDEELKNLLGSSHKCPNYVYAASSFEKKKVGFIFSKVQIDNVKKIFEDLGYKVHFEQETGGDLSEIAEREYLTAVDQLQSNIDEFNNNNWGTKKSDDCIKLSKFGGRQVSGYESSLKEGTNIPIFNYYKARYDLYSVNKKYDFTSGDELISVYSNMKCQISEDNPNNDINNGSEQDVNNCEIIPTGIIKYIKQALNLVRWISLALVILLGVLDFVKATAADDQDAVKKAWQSFTKRLIAVIILFLLPLLIDFILYIVGLTNNCKFDI